MKHGFKEVRCVSTEDERMTEAQIGKVNFVCLTLYGPNSFFHRFSGHNLRKALFVYRLIGATLIGNFLDDPFLK